MKTKLEKFFEKIDRSFFMEINSQYAKVDKAFYIGHGQTISQPSLVLRMTKILDINKKHNVLEIGTGTGYQTSFLAEFSKHVHSVEKIKELQESAIIRLSKLNYNNISYSLGDGSKGYEKLKPYDRIMVTAAASKIPDRLIEQLANNGKMLIPVGTKQVQELTLIIKDHDGNIYYEPHGLVRFVPLVGKFSI